MLAYQESRAAYRQELRKLRNLKMPRLQVPCNRPLFGPCRPQPLYTSPAVLLPRLPVPHLP